MPFTSWLGNSSLFSICCPTSCSFSKWLLQEIARRILIEVTLSLCTLSYASLSFHQLRFLNAFDLVSTFGMCQQYVLKRNCILTQNNVIYEKMEVQWSIMDFFFYMLHNLLNRDLLGRIVLEFNSIVAWLSQVISNSLCIVSASLDFSVPRRLWLATDHNYLARQSLCHFSPCVTDLRTIPRFLGWKCAFSLRV